MCARQHNVAVVACYRLERTLMGCADPSSKGDRRNPISVLAGFTQTKVFGGSCH